MRLRRTVRRRWPWTITLGANFSRLTRASTSSRRPGLADARSATVELRSWMAMGEAYLTQRVDQLDAAIRNFDSADHHTKLAKRLAGRAPADSGREIVRLRDLGAEGRIAEGCLVVVSRSQQLWDAVTAHDLPEDISDREYTQLQEHLLGDVPDSSRMAAPFISVRFTDPEHVSHIRWVFDSLGGESDVTSYRYASLPYYEEVGIGNQAVGELQEPFLVASEPGPRGENRIAGILPVGATFLRYEREFGSIEPTAIARLDAVVLADRAVIHGLVDETLQAIDAAPRRRPEG